MIATKIEKMNKKDMRKLSWKNISKVLSYIEKNLQTRTIISPYLKLYDVLKNINARLLKVYMQILLQLNTNLEAIPHKKRLLWLKVTPNY